MELNKISDLYWKNTPNLFFFSLLLGMITGLCYALLVPFVIYSIGNPPILNLSLEVVDYHYFNSPTAEMAKAFLYTCLAIILIKTTSHVLSIYIVQNSAVQHRIGLYKRLNSLSYAALERIGQPRLINLLNVDIHNISNAATNLPLIWISIITVLGTLGYLFYLNLKVALFVLVCIAIAMLIYQIPIVFGNRFFARSRQSFDRVQLGAKGLIYGAKELKMSREKSHAYLQEELLGPEKQTLDSNLKGMMVITFSQVYGEILSFIVIGIVIFHLTYAYTISQVELFGIVVALLYLTGPVSVILGSLSELQKGRVSLAKIKEFYNEITDQECEGNHYSIDRVSFIQFKDIGYRYEDAQDEFALHNINFRLNTGQITFIVGGNGSGKSTLSKIISLHYQATQGQIDFSGQIVKRDNLQAIREQISVVYTDFHLFPRLYCDWDETTVNEYLTYLELDNKVDIVGGRFSTTRLSDGQRKRLALLTVMLEDKPICLFDEWAADQDPKFKEFFYRFILAKLKKQGKMVIVISHDDRYFDCADQLIVMESGCVREITQQNSPLFNTGKSDLHQANDAATTLETVNGSC